MFSYVYRFVLPLFPFASALFSYMLLELHMESEAPEIIEEDAKRCRRIWRPDRLVFDDGIECRRPSDNVIRFYCKHFAQCVCRSVAFERPDFHFSESLASALGFSSQRLLGDERVRPDRAHVDLVFYHVVELEHIHIAHSHVLFERFAVPPVVELYFPVVRVSRLGKLFANFFVFRTQEWRNYCLVTQRVRCESKVHFKNLPQVHAGRHAKRRKNYVDRGSIRSIRHIFFRQYSGDNSFVAVASGELVSDGNVSDLRDFDHYLLNDACFQSMAQVAGENFHPDYAATFAVLHPERGIFHIAGLFGKDRAEQSFFRSKLSLAFRSNFSDQDVVFADLGADADNTVFIEVLQFKFSDVRNVAGSYLLAKLGVAHGADEFLHVDRSEFAFFDQALGNNDRVFISRAGPGKECHENILSERDLAVDC